MTGNTARFEGMEGLPLPLFVTDEKGKIIYKNKLSEKSFSIRKGRNIMQFADKDADKAIADAKSAGSCAIVPLRDNGEYGLCIVIPEKNDENKTEYIYSLVPYSYDFFDCKSENLAELSELSAYERCFENQINTIRKMLTNGLCEELERAYSILRITTMKLRRLKDRLKSRAAEMVVYTSLNTAAYTDRSINLCSYMPPFLKTFNLLSGVVGFGVTYIPTETYSICRANSSKLSALMVYVLMYCVKFTLCGEISVFVKNENNFSRITFVPKKGFENVAMLRELDFMYLSTMAKAGGFRLELGYTDDGREYISLDIERKSGTAMSVSSSDDMFDVSESFIRQAFMQALGIISEAKG